MKILKLFLVFSLLAFIEATIDFFIGFDTSTTANAIGYLTLKTHEWTIRIVGILLGMYFYKSGILKD